ncbi:L,D-transpeptidase family protein [Lactobacillus mulieris]|uniref:L,D-transpeptidase family protein n=1 Tax=Lactobacillus mulieris TaxID=2508708 RepID=UPI00084E8AD4|nr:L,D-transpeptidase family protein [Lactobacillus mulieris]OEH65663.1 hypothetical protein BFX48_05540 [Lactobacillus jensenii]
MTGKHSKNTADNWFKKNKILVSLFSAIVILSLFGGFIYHNHIEEQRQATLKYTSKHFNKNVKIFGVKVGGLTINQAVTKINKNAKTAATMTDGKITSMKLDGIQVTDKKTVTKYFNKQHTSLPSDKKWNFADNTLKEAKKKLSEFYNAKTTYKVGGKDFSLEAKNLFKTVEYYGGQFHFTDTSALSAKLSQINSEVSTLDKSYSFTTPNGKTITVTNKSYGWGINTKTAIPAIEKALSNGDTTIDGSNYIYGKGYSTYGTGYTTTNNGLGKNYVVVSIKEQKLWIIKNGVVAVTLNDVVTGTAQTSSGSSDATPTGVLYIEYKQSPSTLTGTNDDGSSYSSKVSYWMPFTLSGCGLHDASWRTDWSKTAYLKGGSHGCVNIRPSEIKKVWDAVEMHEAVIVYDN